MNVENVDDCEKNTCWLSKTQSLNQIQLLGFDKNNHTVLTKQKNTLLLMNTLTDKKNLILALRNESRRNSCRESKQKLFLFKLMEKIIITGTNFLLQLSFSPSQLLTKEKGHIFTSNPFWCSDTQRGVEAAKNWN